jgi:hypothetical protein
MRYGRKHLQQVYHSQLLTRRQHYVETLQEFDADITRIVFLAHPSAPSEFIERLSTESFVTGVADPELQRALRLIHPKTLDDALACDFEFQVATETSKTHAHVRSTSVEESLEGRIKKIVSKFLRNRVQPTKRDKCCCDCGELGHVCSGCQNSTRRQEN